MSTVVKRMHGEQHKGEKLRTCPACGNVVAADNRECVRCGITFRAYWMRRFLFWVCLAGGVIWLLHHYGAFGFLRH